MVCIVLLIVGMLLQRFGFIHNKRMAVANGTVSNIVEVISQTPK